MTSSASLVSALDAGGETMATAESLTAGLLAATVADTPGASAVLRGGLIVYATDLKSALVGVDQDVLDRCGPVSETTAAQLAQGARGRCAADWGVSLTGVAGPEPQDGHPVGEVWLGIAHPDGTVDTRRLKLSPDMTRSEIREGAVDQAIDALLDAVRRS